VVGFVIGAGLLAVIRLLLGLSAWAREPSVTLGFLFAIPAWLLGVGVWDYWARGWFNLPLKKYEETGWRRYFSFNTDHKVIGVQYLVTLIGLFLIAGLLAMFIRLELMQPGRDYMSSAVYNDIMSLHGTLMIFVGVATIVGAFGNYVVPIMIGAEDMAYPRLNALSYWFLPPVAILLAASALANGYDTGWTGYPPLAAGTRMGKFTTTWPSSPLAFPPYWAPLI
jgi:cytochrome c oxidase subunit 1